MTIHKHGLYERITENALLYPEKIAFVTGSHRVDFKSYRHRVDNLASGLAKLGLKQKDRAIVLMNNCLEFVEIYGACAKLGVTVVPLNTRTSVDEMNQVIHSTSPEIIIGCDDYRETQLKLVDSYSFKHSVLTNNEPPEGFTSYYSLMEETAREETHASEEDFPFVIIPTAAVDGVTKGACISQNNILASVAVTLSEFPKESLSCNLAFLPLFHIMGVCAVWTTFFIGGKNVIMNKFDGNEVASLIEQEKVTCFGSFPPLLEQILDSLKAQKKKPSILEAVFGIEGPSVIERLHQETNADFWTGYGQAETTGLITIAKYRDFPNSAGRLNVFNQIAVFDENEQRVPIGEQGEIVVRGPIVFGGYWNMEEATGYTFRQGWHHTGDMGKIEADGVLFFQGRKPEKELIKTGGENVYPKEVESVINRHPQVVASVVFGIPNAKWGEAVKAVIQVKPGKSLTSQEIRSHVGEHIAGFKKPKTVTFIDQLPMKNNQVDREAVKEQHCE